MDGAMWMAGSSAMVVGLAGFWWYRLRRIESRAERLMHRMRIEIDGLPGNGPAP